MAVETLITANSALFGFVAAYYMFARMHHRQHIWRLENDPPKEGATVHIQKIRRLLILLNVFLIAATLTFFVSNVFYLAFMGDPSAMVLYLWGNRSFFALFSAVFLWFLFLGAFNLRDNLKVYWKDRK